MQKMSENEYSHLWQEIGEEPKSKLKKVSEMQMNEDVSEFKQHQLFVDNYDEKIMRNPHEGFRLRYEKIIASN